jgi:CHAT domain-containing protein
VAPVDIDRVASALGDRALVEFVDVRGELHAVTLVGGRARRHALGPTAVVNRELASLRFALSRIARGRPDTGGATAAAADAAADRLGELLLAPLLAAIGDRSVVISPTGALHSMPWPMLPALTGRPLRVTPSALLWEATARRSRQRMNDAGRVALVSGVALDHATAEVAALHEVYATATVLNESDATVDAVRHALGTHELVHLAAHGVFRSDNPLFSYLRLADGPLLVHDLETVPRLPDRLVLSACDIGLSTVSAGDELMGFAAAVLAMGTTLLVASVSPVNDSHTPALMTAFHRALATGVDAAAALAGAQQSMPDEARRSSYGFVCFGAG